MGHIVTAEGVAADPAKVEAVTTWPKPFNLKTLCSFLGFLGITDDSSTTTPPSSAP